RYNAAMPMVVTTNHRPEEIDGRILSRLNDRARVWADLGRGAGLPEPGRWGAAGGAPQSPSAGQQCGAPRRRSAIPRRRRRIHQRKRTGPAYPANPAARAARRPGQWLDPIWHEPGVVWGASDWLILFLLSHWRQRLPARQLDHLLR